MRKGGIQSFVVKRLPLMMYLSFGAVGVGVGTAPVVIGMGFYFIIPFIVVAMVLAGYVVYHMQEFIRRDKASEPNSFKKWAGWLTPSEDDPSDQGGYRTEIWPYFHYGPLWSDLGIPESKFDEFLTKNRNLVPISEAYEFSKSYDWFGRPFAYLAAIVGIPLGDITRMEIPMVKKAIAIRMTNPEIDANLVSVMAKNDIDTQLVKSVTE